MKPRFQFRLRTLFVVVTLVAIGCWAVLALVEWHRQQAIKKIEHDLRIEQLGIALKRYEAIEVAYEAGTVPPYDLYIASRDWKESAYECATTKAERVDALQKHYDRMKTWYDKVEALSIAADRGGEADTLYSIKFWELEAKIWLTEEDRK